jgi:hypothetical protein
MMISDATVFKKLSDRVWQTPAQVTDELRQCGPLAFVSDQEHRRFFDGSGKEQCGTEVLLISVFSGNHLSDAKH